MEKKLNYTFETRRYGDEYDYENFKFTVDNEMLLDFVVDCVYDKYYRQKSELSYNAEFVDIVKKGLKKLIDENDYLEDLVDGYEDELEDYFRDEAFYDYKNRG